VNSTAAIAILVNDQPREIGAQVTLLQLLADQGLAERKGIAAAVNGEVVPRSAWRARALAEGDRVLIIRATQGG
jgi:sulfur carrier protein